MRVITAGLFILILLMPLAQAQSLNEVFQECPGTIVGSTEPRQIHLQVTDDPTTMNVMWATEGLSLIHI